MKPSDWSSSCSSKVSLISGKTPAETRFPPKWISFLEKLSKLLKLNLSNSARKKIEEFDLDKIIQDWNYIITK